MDYLISSYYIKDQNIYAFYNFQEVHVLPNIKHNENLCREQIKSRIDSLREVVATLQLLKTSPKFRDRISSVFLRWFLGSEYQYSKDIVFITDHLQEVNQALDIIVEEEIQIEEDKEPIFIEGPLDLSNLFGLSIEDVRGIHKTMIKRIERGKEK